MIFVFTLYPFAAWGASVGPVSIEIIHSTDKYEQGGTYPILFRLNIAEGWFIHGTAPEEEYLIPTVLSIRNSSQLNISVTKFPKPQKEKFEYISRPVEVYSGTVLVQGVVKVGRNAAPGIKSIQGNLSYQACSAKMCLPPGKIPVKFNLVIVPKGTKTSSLNSELFQSSDKLKENSFAERFNSGLFLALLWILFQGLALNLTPCIYPLIPITVSYFGGRSNKSSSNTILLGLLYISGLATTNSLLGVTAALSGGMLGAALQYPAVLILIALIMTSLGLSFFGLWEFRLPSGLTRFASKNREGYFGSFFMGLTLGIVAAPCIGPFVLGLLIYVGKMGDPFLGFLYFFVLSLGMGLPLCLLAMFSGAINRLPMSGDWMLWVKKVMGWILIAMGYFFINSLIKNILVERAIFLGLAIIAGIHLGWLDNTGKSLRFFKYIKRVAGCIIILAGLFHFFASVNLAERVKWIPYNDALLQKAALESKPVVFDVYADWCIPCRQMDKQVFTDPGVRRLSERFIMVRLDITRKQPGQDKIRHRFGIKGAPTILFFNKKGRELSGLRIESKIDVNDLILDMKKTLGSS